MKRIFFALTLLAFSVPISGAQSVIELWNAQRPAPHASVLQGQESAPDDEGRISNISKATMSVFLPEKSKNTGKAVIICPGGGYWLLATYKEGTFFAELLAKNGITAIVLKYRMPAAVHQIPLEDADRAMELTAQNAARWGIDTAKIGVMGFSAGGHLAATLSTMGAMKPAFSVLFYPVISMREGIAHEGSREQLMGNKPLREYYSAELNVDRTTPPALIFHCSDDQSVSLANSIIYCEALKAHKIPHELVICPTGGHGWGFTGGKLPPSDRAMVREKLLDWLSKI